ncbi:hypothetical protein H0H81_012375 [Sphagnurus paluster]|uniref:Uncharacterized protein n=1 Tax=Sphagnurus paluster TaxID=117069 RepID=A0A9P7FNA5_9AGAR|nr:hypothetical protein H0H81_012375 [Sphagnurus paluster]
MGLHLDYLTNDLQVQGNKKKNTNTPAFEIVTNKILISKLTVLMDQLKNTAEYVQHMVEQQDNYQPRPPPINIDKNNGDNDAQETNMQEVQQQDDEFGLLNPQPSNNNVFLKQVLNMMTEMCQEMKALIQAINDKVEKVTNVPAPAPKHKALKTHTTPTLPHQHPLVHPPLKTNTRISLTKTDADLKLSRHHSLTPTSIHMTTPQEPLIQATHSNINSIWPAIEGLNMFQSVGKNGKPAKQKVKRTTKLDTTHSLRRRIISAMPGDKQSPQHASLQLNMALMKKAKGLFSNIHPGGPIQLVSWTKGNNIAVNMDDCINSESFIGLVETVSSTIESILGMGEGAVQFRPWVKTVKFQLAHIPVWDWLADEALEAEAVGMFIKESTAFKGITLASEFCWIRKPETFTSSQNCGVSFSAKDADGKVTERLLAMALSINGQ